MNPHLDMAFNTKKMRQGILASYFIFSEVEVVGGEGMILHCTWGGSDWLLGKNPSQNGEALT